MKNFIALLIVSFCLVLSLNSYASDRKQHFATGEAYIDVATGHKYTKNSDKTYKEFSKKGVLLRKSVPNSLPLLTTNKYIRKISRDCYMRYEKNNNGIKESVLLTLNQAHPEGWLFKEVLIPIE